MKKRWFAFLMLSVLAIGISGCGNKKEAETTGTESAVQEEDSQEEGAEEQKLTKLVSLGEYKGISYPEVDEKELDKRVARQILTIQQDSGEYVADEEKTVVADGDMINLDYSGEIDGVKFDGGTAEDQQLLIGSHSFIDTFEEQLIGTNVGDSKDVVVTFPEDYGSEDLAGKEAVFHCTVNAVLKYTYPEWTDEFAAEKFGASSAESYEEMIRGNLYSQLREKNILQAVIDNCEYDISDEEIEGQYTNVLFNYQYMAYTSGMNYDTFMENKMGGITQEELEEECRASARFQILNTLMVEAVAEKEGIAITDEEYSAAAAEKMVQYGYSDFEKFETDYNNYYGEDGLRKELIFDKTVSFIVDNAQ